MGQDEVAHAGCGKPCEVEQPSSPTQISPCCQRRKSWHRNSTPSSWEGALHRHCRRAEELEKKPMLSELGKRGPRGRSFSGLAPR